MATHYFGSAVHIISIIVDISIVLFLTFVSKYIIAMLRKYYKDMLHASAS